MIVINAERAYQVLRHLAELDVEEFWAVALNSQKRVLRSKMLFRGTVDRCPIHLRDVFRFACLENASSILVAHNHPSSSPEPSEEDLAITERLALAGEMMDIPVVDHIIVAKDGYSSLAARGLLEPGLRASRRGRSQRSRGQSGAKSGTATSRDRAPERSDETL